MCPHWAAVAKVNQHGARRQRATFSTAARTGGRSLSRAAGTCRPALSSCPVPCPPLRGPSRPAGPALPSTHLRAWTRLRLANSWQSTKAWRTSRLRGSLGRGWGSLGTRLWAGGDVHPTCAIASPSSPAAGLLPFGPPRGSAEGWSQVTPPSGPLPQTPPSPLPGPGPLSSVSPACCSLSPSCPRAFAPAILLPGVLFPSCVHCHCHLLRTFLPSALRSQQGMQGPRYSGPLPASPNTRTSGL